MQIISPADGVVKDIVKEARQYHVHITLNLWNKHYQIAPITGIVKDVKYKQGKFLNAVFNKRAAFENERNEITIRNEKNHCEGYSDSRIACKKD